MASVTDERASRTHPGPRSGDRDTAMVVPGPALHQRPTAEGERVLPRTRPGGEHRSSPSTGLRIPV